MHELACATDIYENLKKIAQENNFTGVKKIKLSVGVASGIDAELLRHSLVDHLFVQSIFADSELEIVIEKPSLMCRDCRKIINEQEMEKMIPSCPWCAGTRLDILSGDGIKILEIEGISDG